LFQISSGIFDIQASDDQVVFGKNEAPPHTWPLHVLLSVPLEPDEIERIGARKLARQDLWPQDVGAGAILSFFTS
jgi:hypothetical protein